MTQYKYARDVSTLKSDKMLNYNINRYSAPLRKLEHYDAMDGFQLAIKRGFDILFSIIGLIIFSPLLIIFSVVLLFSKGPVIFRQERIGYKGKPFIIYKFRTMRTDAEDDVWITVNISWRRPRRKR